MTFLEAWAAWQKAAAVKILAPSGCSYYLDAPWGGAAPCWRGAGNVKGDHANHK